MSAPVVPTITIYNTPNELRVLLNAAFTDYAAKIVELEAALAIACSHYEGSGTPDVVLAAVTTKNGDTYKDTLNKMRYEKSEGVWLEV